MLGIYGVNPSKADNISRSIYSYDDHGRIIKEAKKYLKPDLPVYNFYYAYDANGNQIRSGVIYDNKENLHRTNKIWQLLARDYSINNPRTGVTYNRFNLPTSFNLPYPDILYFIREISITHSNIFYDCKDKDVDEEKEDSE